MLPNRPTCRQRILASSSAGSLDVCEGCGGLSLHVGAMTLRMNPATAEALWVMLGEGLAKLSTDTMPTPRGHA